MHKPQFTNSSKKRSTFTRDGILRLAVTIGTILISMVVLFFLVYNQKEVLLTYTWDLRALPGLFSFLLFSFTLFLVAFTWASIMKSLGSTVGIYKHIQYFCISNVAKRIPGTLWYIASRAQLYKKEGHPIHFTSLASGVEMGISVIAGVLVAIFFAVSIINQYQVSWIILGSLLLLSAAILYPSNFRKILRRFGSDVNLFDYTDLMLWLVFYILAWILGGVILFTVGNIFIEIPLRYLWYVIGSWGLVGVLSTALFFSPSNLGITEVGLSLLLSQIVPSPIAVLIALAVRVLIILYEIFWALICLGWNLRSEETNNPKEV